MVRVRAERKVVFLLMKTPTQEDIKNVCVCVWGGGTSLFIVPDPSKSYCWSVLPEKVHAAVDNPRLTALSCRHSDSLFKHFGNMDRIGVSFQDPLDEYELIHRIGCGTYGEVFKVSLLYVNTTFEENYDQSQQ